MARKQKPLLGTPTPNTTVFVVFAQKTIAPARNSDPNTTPCARSCFPRKRKPLQGTLIQDRYPMCPSCTTRPAGDMVVEKSCLHFWGPIATKVAKHVAEPILAPESRFRGIRLGNLHHSSRSIRSDWSEGWGARVSVIFSFNRTASPALQRSGPISV